MDTFPGRNLYAAKRLQMLTRLQRNTIITRIHTEIKLRTSDIKHCLHKKISFKLHAFIFIHFMY